MTERQLQFRVGLFIVTAFVAVAGLIFKFSELRSFWEESYAITVHFETAPGVYPATPVRRNGITIGKVQEVTFDQEQGGVFVVLAIRPDCRLRTDAAASISRTILGDSSIEFTPGTEAKFLSPGSRIKGDPPTDPFEIVNRMERQINDTLGTFRDTSREWQKVGQNLNSLVETNRGNLDLVVERTAESLAQLGETMANLNKTLDGMNAIVADPENQENLRKTLASLPELVSETRQTILTVRTAVEKADQTLVNMAEVTEPLANRSTSIVTKLDGTLTNLEMLSAELKEFAEMASQNEGSLRMLATDPELYRNLNSSAGSLAILLKNLEPVVHDVRIFSDKIARHPELIGVSGAMRGSSGIKDAPEEPAIRQVEGRRPIGTGRQ